MSSKPKRRASRRLHREFTGRYRVKTGFHIPADRAQSLGERIKQLGREDSRLSGATVLRDARDPNSPFHELIDTWDAEKAAELHWKERLAYLIRGIEEEVVTYNAHGRELERDWVPITQTVLNPGSRGRALWGKELTEDIVHPRFDKLKPGVEDDTEDLPINPARVNGVLAAAVSYLRGFVRKYQRVMELTDAVSHIQDIIDDLVINRRLKKLPGQKV